MEAILRSILDEILESKLTAILPSILDAKLKAYEEWMTFFNTSFETMKVKMNNLEKQTKTLAQEKARPKLKYYNSDIRLGRHGESNIFIQESVTEAKRKLLKNCLKFHKDQNYKFIWTYYGVIYLRRNEHTPASRLTSVGDWERLQPRRSTSESTSTATTEVSSQPS